MYNLKIIGVNVFLRKTKTHTHVGVLKKEQGSFVFIYDDQYFTSRNALSLGPEFPLTKREFISTTLFPSFNDRIPSRQNPAYPEYCLSMGIDTSESDPIILLCTIGRKGPSSFVFAPLFERGISSQNLIDFRNSLNLTTREFAQVFEFSQASLNAFETNKTSGKNIVKRLEMIILFPSVALYLLKINSGVLIYQKRINAINEIKKRML
ncbi:MAG: hypothetical protein HN411_01060 [Waddliaceae bacterium]|jgi:HipA-like protein|nr:hypothetical protein [Waddliaceae bacterium]MBT3579658.1 hypothetical protein [Waddliaceae bacterium]MBT4445243.1 hypothetical protein [Waddliaceae bacterium]MBT6928097.1 hypothetical protein [Waddliaceae bacterium]MBT7264658.1 hypothetical protein [Waddliaceae bacterium]